LSPKLQQVFRRRWRRYVLAFDTVFLAMQSVLRVVVSLWLGTLSRMRNVRECTWRMGHRTWSPVRCWERTSIFSPFFWSMNVILAYSASVKEQPSGRIHLWLSRKTAWPVSIFLVCPGSHVIVCSQDRIAKKKVTIAREAVTAAAVSRVA
jgi:hypothetical protein